MIGQDTWKPSGSLHALPAATGAPQPVYAIEPQGGQIIHLVSTRYDLERSNPCSSNLDTFAAESGSLHETIHSYRTNAVKS